MLETSKKLIEVSNELVGMSKSMFEDSICYTNGDPGKSYKAMYLAMKYVDAVNEYIAKTAEMIDSMDNKLNKLLKVNEIEV